MPSGRGLVWVLLATLGWSLSGMFVRLLPALDGWQINCWRGFWLAVTLLVYLAVRHGRNLGKVFLAVPAAAMVISALCFALGTTCYIASLTLINTATVSTIGATSPLVTAAFSKWLTGEKPSPLIWLAGALALGGMAIIAGQGVSLGSGLGLVVAFAVPLTFALQTLFLRRYRDHDLMTAIALGGLISFVVAGFVSVGVTGQSSFAIDAHAMLLLFAMGVVQLGLPLILYGWGAKTVPAVILSLIAMLDAVFNPFWSWVFAGEVPDAHAVIGGLVILAAVLIYIVAGRRPGPEPVAA